MFVKCFRLKQLTDWQIMPKSQSTKGRREYWTILIKKLAKTGSTDRTSVSGRRRLLRTHEYTNIVFTARCYASAVLAMGLCPSVSVCVCVCLSQAGVLLKRQNVGSHKQHHTIPPGTLVFWCQRSPRNSTGVTPYGGAKCRWGGSKSATFDK